MARQSAWRGALEVAGFPVPVALYSRVKSRSNDSLRTIGPDKKPIHKVTVSHTEFEKLEVDVNAKVTTLGETDTKKGVETARGEWKALKDEDVEKIKEAERSKMVSPTVFVPRGDLPLSLALNSYRVIPDDKVAGSEQAVEQVWNGLMASKLAYTTEVQMRAGSRDAVLAVWAEEAGLFAATFPFVDEVYTDVDDHQFKTDAKARKLFNEVILNQYEVADTFSFDRYVSTWAQRREDAINAVRQGKAPKKRADTKKRPADDLIAALEAQVKGNPPKKAKAPAKKRAKAKA